ncbi:MAG TPA: 7-carboxy-7-deazaguanine synthase QueE [Chitinophagales bacterium]|nr:7-carboxy-7-deazaguanine synthase QueE [Chitinophagales bacterium]
MNFLAADTRIEIPVMETYLTLQGEGFHQGKAAYFIRLAGCDIGCMWCDVKESWDVDESQIKSIKEITAEAALHKSRMAVITGGEPLMYNLDTLTKALQQEGFRTHLETSGAYPLTGTWDWICLSPKKFKPPLPGIFQYADELKVIVYNKSDFKWAEENAEKVSAKCKLFLQPEWSRAEQLLPLIIDYIRQHPQWELSVQLHKYLHMP